MGTTTERAGRSADMKSIAREHGFVPLRVEGTLPPELEGTLVRTGPGLYESFGQSIAHSFEADGALMGVRLGSGKAYGAVRLVESEGLLEERRRGKPLFGSRASALMRLRNGAKRRSKNTGNTSVPAWQHRLFALVESNKPMEISPDDLSTLGETDLGGAVRTAFSAHPHAVVSRKAFYNFGLSYGRRTSLTLYELPFHGRARRMWEVPLREPVMLHDFAVTERYAVFFVAPARLRIARALFGSGGFGSMVAWEPTHGTEVLVVPLDAPDELVRFEVPAFFQWHFAGCWERGDELHVHYARYGDMKSFEQLRGEGVSEPAKLHRAIVDPKRRTLRSEAVWEGASEFPVIDRRFAGGAYRTLLLTSDAEDRRAVAKVDLETRAHERFVLDEGERPSEVVFVPRSEDAREGDGYGLSMIYDAKSDTSHLAIFDTARWTDGPVARCFFETYLPMSFHGTWVPRAR